MFGIDEGPPTFMRYLKQGLPFLGQFLLVYPATLLVAIPISSLLPYLDRSPSALPSGYHDFSFEALSCVVIGALLGGVIGTMRPSLIPLGRLIWIVPFMFFLAEAVPYLTETAMDQFWLPEYIIDKPGNEGLAVAICTLPAASTVGYALGLISAARLACIFRPPS